LYINILNYQHFTLAVQRLLKIKKNVEQAKNVKIIAYFHEK